ncbi:adenosylmethionine-8-amino-7-oxononanoate aminotransferase [Tamaricihabitans halophyticus]|uniref:Adenosylmethionine-8-amino-7-oxononanoate aminotransferase n=1 Tax=Tamaricihabitans halophyticus TaxID=1262583 RepID=A0A4V2SV57_9PSEU|nr:aminotransferase class III-fold pyridoxal phosphate-dependent enzyme [Tamaricihabitans halophyticus]TCP57186.1 adenosylmethionine-8-amino-7-oxononanoate aminotransferase [Tamaricihabitans halophyticus]
MDSAALRSNARKYLGPHFTTKNAWWSDDLPVFVRGSGCYLYDSDGNRLLDGLAGLFSVNIGHGRTDIVAAASKQMELLPYATNWGTAHAPAIEAATLLAELTPGELNTTFFVNSGSEAIETAVKFARQYHRSQGQPERYKVISRESAYHGTTFGALSVNGVAKLREPFEPLLQGFRHVQNTLGYTGDCGPAAELDCVRAIEQAILEEGPELVAAVVAEPVQNAGGVLVPPDGYWRELRRICDKYGILLVADEVINGFGRLGRWFGSELVGGEPDMMTVAKGITSSYSPLGGLVVRESLVGELFESPQAGTFTHGATWGGHPVSTATAVANLTALRDEKVVDNAATMGRRLQEGLAQLAQSHRCVLEVRGTGMLYAVELTANSASGRELTADESKRVLQEVLPAAYRRTGVMLRADDRRGTNISISPPLVLDEEALTHLLDGVDGMLADIEAAIPA